VHDDRDIPAVVQGYFAGRWQRGGSWGPILVLHKVTLRPPRAGVGRFQATLVDGGRQLIGEGERVVRHARCFGQGWEHQGWEESKRAVG